MSWIVENLDQSIEFHNYEKMSDYITRYIKSSTRNNLTVNKRKVKPWGGTWVFVDGKGPYG